MISSLAHRWIFGLLTQEDRGCELGWSTEQLLITWLTQYQMITPCKIIVTLDYFSFWR